MTFPFLSSAKLIFLMGLSTVFGYTSTINQPFVKPFGMTQEFSKVILETDTKGPFSKKKISYDLGLDKNKPLQGTATNYLQSTEDPTRFLVEHESVHEFPSPRNDVTKSSETGKTRSLPTVHFERKSKDVLLIMDEVATIPKSSPRMVLRTTKQLELNTAWVEMLIYSEQAKLASA